jgi:hypothetical protein
MHFQKTPCGGVLSLNKTVGLYTVRFSLTSSTYITVFHRFSNDNFHSGHRSRSWICSVSGRESNIFSLIIASIGDTSNGLSQHILLVHQSLVVALCLQNL